MMVINKKFQFFFTLCIKKVTKVTLLYLFQPKPDTLLLLAISFFIKKLTNSVRQSKAEPISNRRSEGEANLIDFSLFLKDHLFIITFAHCLSYR